MWIIGIYFVRQIRNLVKSKMIRSNGCYFDLQWQKWATSFSTVYALHRLLFPGTAARQTLTWLCIRALASACSAVCRSVCVFKILCVCLVVLSRAYHQPAASYLWILVSHFRWWPISTSCQVSSKCLYSQPTTSCYSATFNLQYISLISSAVHH